MSSKSDYSATAVLAHLTGTSDIGTLPDIHLALYTANPDEGGTHGNECVSGLGYARVDVTWNAPSGSNPVTATGPVANADFWPSGASAGENQTVTHFAIVDTGTESADNILYYGSLTSSKTITEGDILRIPAGSITITET